MTKNTKARENSPDQEDAAPKSTRRLKQRGKRAPSAPVAPEIRDRRAALSAEARADLSALLTGGLWTYEGLPAEEAVPYVVAAQLKALRLALRSTDGPGWCTTDDELTDEDIAAVLGWASAALKSTQQLIPELRERGELLDSFEQRAARTRGGAL